MSNKTTRSATSGPALIAQLNKEVATQIKIDFITVAVDDDGSETKMVRVINGDDVLHYHSPEEASAKVAELIMKLARE